MSKKQYGLATERKLARLIDKHTIAGHDTDKMELIDGWWVCRLCKMRIRKGE